MDGCVSPWFYGVNKWLIKQKVKQQQQNKRKYIKLFRVREQMADTEGQKEVLIRESCGEKKMKRNKMKWNEHALASINGQRSLNFTFVSELR